VAECWKPNQPFAEAPLQPGFRTADAKAPASTAKTVAYGEKISSAVSTASQGRAHLDTVLKMAGNVSETSASPGPLPQGEGETERRSGGRLIRLRTPQLEIQEQRGGSVAQIEKKKCHNGQASQPQKYEQNLEVQSAAAGRMTDTTALRGQQGRDERRVSNFQDLMEIFEGQKCQAVIQAVN
jgi:hypothetical protein